MNESVRPAPLAQYRLDRALTEAGRQADPVSRAQIDAFEAVLRSRRRGNFLRGASLRGDIDYVIMPEISDLGIFNATRSMDLLNHIITSLLPLLDASEDVISVAKAMLEEEIANRRDLEAQLEIEGRQT